MTELATRLTEALEKIKTLEKEKASFEAIREASEALLRLLDARDNVRLSEVEAQQKEILKTVRRLADEGTIVIGGGADDAMV